MEIEKLRLGYVESEVERFYQIQSSLSKLIEKRTEFQNLPSMGQSLHTLQHIKYQVHGGSILADKFVIKLQSNYFHELEPKSLNVSIIILQIFYITKYQILLIYFTLVRGDQLVIKSIIIKKIPSQLSPKKTSKIFKLLSLTDRHSICVRLLYVFGARF